jgi:hypothetical protein
MSETLRAVDIVRHPEVVESEQMLLTTPAGTPILDGDAKKQTIAVPVKLYGKDRRRLSVNQEQFCWAYVFGGIETMGNQAASYELAYGTRDTSNASRLMKCDFIRERIDELTRDRNRELGISKEQWVASMRELGISAKQAGQYSPAIRAFEIIGKAAGYLDEHVSITHRDGRTVAEKMDDIAAKLMTPGVADKLIAQKPELGEAIRRVMAMRAGQTQRAESGEE